jgi:LCP family protein required for cell wall assembly
MRIPLWLVMLWVLGIAVVAAGASLASYAFVRDRAVELDSVLELPDPPQIGRPLSLAPEDSETVAATPQPDSPPDAGDTAEPTTAAPETAGDAPPTGDAGDSAAEPDNGEPEYQPYDDPRRVSVLLLGIDQREGEVGPFVTDTLILFSIDPIGKTGAILSIPRDLWVELPGIGQWGRINGANIVGDEISYPGGGGPAYAIKVVEQVLGLNTIDYFVVINFEVFTTLIDAIGPIEVCPSEPIDDDLYPDGSYGYISIHFDAGCQELEADRLLQYARTRHADSDIGRSTRQQEVILAVREKVLSTGGVFDLIPEGARLWQSLRDNVRTNMSFEDMVQLALKAEEIEENNIRRAQISFSEVELGLTAEGDEVLVPIGTDIQLLMRDLFRPAGAASLRE